MSESKDTIALNIRLKPSDSSTHPRAANYTNVGVAEGIALVPRVAMDISILPRMHQQIQRVLVGLREPMRPMPKD